jgi:hypothetical protein
VRIFGDHHHRAVRHIPYVPVNSGYMSTTRNKVPVSHALDYPFCISGNPLYSTDMGIVGFKCCFTALVSTSSQYVNVQHRYHSRLSDMGGIEEKKPVTGPVPLFLPIEQLLIGKKQIYCFGNPVIPISLAIRCCIGVEKGPISSFWMADQLSDDLQDGKIEKARVLMRVTLRVTN